MELGVHGDRFLGGKEKYLGEVDIPSEAAAKQMGIVDQGTGLDICLGPATYT